VFYVRSDAVACKSCQPAPPSRPESQPQLSGTDEHTHTQTQAYIESVPHT